MTEEKAIGKMIVRGVEYAVRLHTVEPTKWTPQGAARFTTRVSGKDLSAETWEALYAGAMVASKEAIVKVNVPLLQLAPRQLYSSSVPSRFRTVTLTGKHQKNGNYLIRYSTGNGKETTEQVDRYSRADNFYMPMPEEAQAEGLRLMEANRKADEALAKWKRAHEASLDSLFEVAEQEAMEKLDREEGREGRPVVRPTRAKRRV